MKPRQPFGVVSSSYSITALLNNDSFKVLIPSDCDCLELRKTSSAQKVPSVMLLLSVGFVAVVANG